MTNANEIAKAVDAWLLKLGARRTESPADFYDWSLHTRYGPLGISHRSGHACYQLFTAFDDPEMVPLEITTNPSGKWNTYSEETDPAAVVESFNGFLSWVAPRVLIEIRGGILTAVYADAPFLECALRDWDDDPDGTQPLKWSPSDGPIDDATSDDNKT